MIANKLYIEKFLWSHYQPYNQRQQKYEHRPQARCTKVSG